ncbi:MAG: hypothetical protein V3V18_15770 [Methylococcales bacterium]
MLARILILHILLLSMVGCGGRTTTPTADPALSSIPAQVALIEEWGIEAESIKLSAAGYMLDFRYKVLDPIKAAKVVNRKNKPYLLNERSGMTTRVPAPANIGPLRHTGGNLKQNTKYFVLFSNPGRSISKGDHVTVVMGQYKLEHISVE